MFAHGHDFRDNSVTRPLNSEYFCQLLQILSSSLSNRKHRVAKPTHAKLTQFLIEELYAKLACEQWNIHNDSQAYSPLLVFRQLDNCRKE